MDVFEEARQLSQVPIFSKLDKSRLKLVAFTSEQLRLGDGEFLFHLGDPSDSVYLILDGILELVVEHDGGEIDVILTRGKNGLIGEMGVISNAPRSMSIRASGSTTVLRIEADTFMTLLTENPSMSLYVMRDLSTKLSESTIRELKTLEHEPRTQ